MTKPVSDLALMIAGMEPVLNAGVYVFISVPHGTDTSMLASIATVREAQGLTLVVAEELVQEAISCNVVAGAYHDHIFVPVDLANKALSVLKRLQDA